MDTTQHITQEQASALHGKRYYAFTSNGDWMELGGGPDSLSGEPPSVFFLALDVEGDDEFYERAERGEGEVLAQVSMDVERGRVRMLEPAPEGVGRGREGAPPRG